MQGRLYTGIDSLNSAALEWLDRECNGTIHERTRKDPRELFREESKHLEKVQTEDVEVAIRAVSDKNAVIYGWSKYELPRSRVKQYDQVRIEEVDGMLMFYKADTGELIHKCRKLRKKVEIFHIRMKKPEWRRLEKAPSAVSSERWKISRTSFPCSGNRTSGMPMFR